MRSRHSGCSAACARHRRSRRAPVAKAGIEAPTAKSVKSTTWPASVHLSKESAKLSLGRSATLIHRKRPRLTVYATPMTIATAIIPSPIRRWRRGAERTASHHCTAHTAEAAPKYT
ncbi:hypothetical protein GA0115246_102716 [Streptomyces sp. SolWspMP-sol7th]|nr:hypothetical protein GA0115246_102716 [Streptomyces sp. SolWspMP-sol7th]